jgi:hypothetical protein
MQSEIKIDRFYFEVEQFAVSILSEFELVFRRMDGCTLKMESVNCLKTKKDIFYFFILKIIV